MPDLQPCDQHLFEALRIRRLQLARAHGVPPYVIFHDSALREMATLRPTNEHSLSAIGGVGEQKLARFGELFIEVIRRHSSAQQAQTD